MSLETPGALGRCQGWNLGSSLEPEGFQEPLEGTGMFAAWNREDQGDLLGAGGRKSDVPCW